MPSDPVDRPSASTRTLLLGIWSHLCLRRRIQLGLLLLVMLTSGLAELLSLGAVLPFLAVINDPQRLWQQPTTQLLVRAMGFTSPTQLVMPATLIFASAAVAAALVRLANLWLNGRLAAAVGSDLSCEAYQRTLYQPYEVHIKRNSAEVITGATTHISNTVLSLNGLLQLITSAVVATSLLAGLLFIDSSVALAGAALFGTIYVVLATTVRRQLRINGLKIVEASGQQIRALQEGLGAIRDILLDGTQFVYLDIYRKADRPQRQLQAKNAFLSAFPRFGLEALGMVAIALLGWLLVSQQGKGDAVIPLLGALALGSQRLLPALQQIYISWAQLTYNNASIQVVLDLVGQPIPRQIVQAKPLLRVEEFTLNEVCFRYDINHSDVLKGLNVEIRCGEHIGVIGSTGSGKSTMIDIIMGLLVPTTGQVLLDGANLHDPVCNERLHSWRTSIAHVPQSIYLSDRSIAENIAFGIPRHQIDLFRLKKAAAQAQIAGFIEEMPEGYDSLVGERGIRLSGGQRQRIGIARAIYKQARVLIFDEGTSALDHDTEEAVMNAIEGLSRDLTVILIAHRLTTVERCDRIIRLHKGSIVADGPPQKILPYLSQREE